MKFHRHQYKLLDGIKWGTSNVYYCTICNRGIYEKDLPKSYKEKFGVKI